MTEVMRLLKHVCMIMDTVLHFQSLVLSLLMPEVALYDKWDQRKVNWSAVTLLGSLHTSYANPLMVKSNCLSVKISEQFLVNNQDVPGF